MKKILMLFCVMCFIFCSCLSVWADDTGIDSEKYKMEQSSLQQLSDAEKEMRIGNLFDLYTTETFVILEDNALKARLTQIVEKIVKISDYPDLQYKVKIINDPLPVASSFPNGYVFISTGLLDILENEDELASVLSHVIARMHGKYQYDAYASEWKRRVAIKVGTQVLAFALAFAGGAAIGADIGDDLAKAAIAIGTVAAVSGTVAAGNKMMKTLPAKKVSLNKMGPQLYSCDLASSTSVFIFFREIYEGYDSEKELKATERAIQYMNNSGYQSKAVVAVLEKLSKLKDEYIANGYICNLLIAQPGFERRIAYAQEFIEK